MTPSRNPALTADIIIETKEGIVLIKRKNPPYGWALPGGFVDYGESLETAAVREAAEETRLDVKLKEQFHAYSDPNRDPRQHTATVVFIAEAEAPPPGRPMTPNTWKSLPGRIFRPSSPLTTAGSSATTSDTATANPGSGFSVIEAKMHS